MTKLRQAKRRPLTRSTPNVTRGESLESRHLMAADLVAMSPAAGATNVAVDSVLITTWSDDLLPGPGAGNIELVDATTNQVIETINVRSDNVTINGNEVTIQPTRPLPSNTEIAVRTDLGVFRDESPSLRRTSFYAEDFEQVALQNSELVPLLDHYVAVFSGTLDVRTAGRYTFGVNSSDGQQLAIDVNQDGLSLSQDRVIHDDHTHERQDRLSTCSSPPWQPIQTCEGDGNNGIQLAIGQYDFQFMYFEETGGSGGEFFYAPGIHEVFNEDEFVLVGDSSKGIAVVDGITVTTYKQSPGATISNLSEAEEVSQTPSLQIGTATLELADIAEDAGGRFAHDHEIPGARQWRLDNNTSPNDYSPVGPSGWTRDNSNLVEGGADEYNGWTWLDQDFWIAHKEDGGRSDFQLANGTVLVADSDAHEDFVANVFPDVDACMELLEPGPACGLFSTSVEMPRIYLDGVNRRSVQLSFDSSWWDEDTQSAEARIQYFDSEGEPLQTDVLFRWESMFDSPNYKPQFGDDEIDALNEQISMPLDIPAEATSLTVTFEMPYATDDWWWAIDNIDITARVRGNLSDGIDDNETWSFTTGGSEQPSSATVGDLNEDGEVGFVDFLILSQFFGQDVDEPTKGDSDGDGTVGFTDFLILSQNFGKSVDEIFAGV